MTKRAQTMCLASFGPPGERERGQGQGNRANKGEDREGGKGSRRVTSRAQVCFFISYFAHKLH